MKSYSFIRETVPIVMQTKPKEGNSALSITTSIASSASMTDVLLKGLAVVAGEHHCYWFQSILDSTEFTVYI